jgi:hypothetical protein
MGPFWPSELCKSKEFPTLVVFYWLKEMNNLALGMLKNTFKILRIE